MSITNGELQTIARLLRIAMGYESREIRIGAIMNSRYLDVTALGHRLEKAGLMTETSVKDQFTFGSYTPPRID